MNYGTANLSEASARMDVFESTNFRLLHFAARFRSKPDSKNRGGNAKEVVALVEQLMSDGLYAEEFAYLDDPNVNYFEMLPVLENFLNKLEWQPLNDESEFRFMTALYSMIGKKSDFAAYYAIRRWMEEVGQSLQHRFSDKFVADGIGAEQIYACYYAFSIVNDADLIPSVKNPGRHNWEAEGKARPKTIFVEWLTQNPNDFDEHRPINIDLLKNLVA